MREHTSSQLLGLASFLLIASTAPTHALTFSSYTAAANDRFSSGYGSVPVPNASPSFVGAPYDLSGVAWATQDVVKSLVLITPQHYLTTVHWGGAASVTILDRSGTLETRSQARTTNTGIGFYLTSMDLGVGSLTTPFSPSQVARYGILDLYSTSTTSGNEFWNYIDQPLLTYGRGPLNPLGSPRVVNTTVGYTPDIHTLRTDAFQAKLEAYDSGGALFNRWINPTGVTELTVAGNHSAASYWENIHNSVVSMEAMNALNAISTPDGFALRIVGNSAAKWTGTGALLHPENWDNGMVPSDRYVGLDPKVAASTQISVDTDALVRGINVTDLEDLGQGFALTGTGTLSIGRGGVANYSENRLTLGAGVRLDDHQYWSTGAGGVTVGNLDTNGKLVEFGGGTAANRIEGAVTGSGSLAVSEGELQIAGSANQTGSTWVHEGTLRVTGTVTGGKGVKLGAGGALTGTGSVNLVEGSGLVSPGASPGILTLEQLNPAGGLDFAFEFTTKGLPDFGAPAASLNDVLRITGQNAFTSALGIENELWIFLNVQSISHGDRFIGGFFFDQDPNLLSSLSGATLKVFLANANGDTTFGGQTYGLYTGPEHVSIGVREITAAFSTGSVTGLSMEIVAMPEPKLTATLTAFACLGLVYARRRFRLRDVR